MRVLVCGGRDFNDWIFFRDKLDELIPYMTEKVIIISGMAKGADKMAVRWAEENWLEVNKYPADWTVHGKAAGFIRNQQMIDEGKPDLVIAFPGRNGTADMIRRAKNHNIKVIEVER